MKKMLMKKKQELLLKKLEQFIKELLQKMVQVLKIVLINWLIIMLIIIFFVIKMETLQKELNFKIKKKKKIEGGVKTFINHYYLIINLTLS